MLIPPRLKVVIEPLYDKDWSPSGLVYLPETSKERCDQGIVKYIGIGCRNVYVGAHVIFSGYAGETVQIEGEGTLIIINENEIAAIIEPQDISVEGLYFKDKSGEYHTITYEQAMHLISMNLDVVNKVDRSLRSREAKKYYGKYSPKDFNEYVEDQCEKCGTILLERKE